MNKRHKRALFPFGALDYRAAEEWLNEQARQGWELQRLTMGGRALLQASTQPPRQYAVVLWTVSTASSVEAEEYEAYQKFLESCGWTPVTNTQLFHIFATQPGETLPPVETDPAAEAMRIRRRFVRQQVTGWLISLLYFGFIWMLLRGTHISWLDVLSSNMVLATACILPFFLGLLITQAVRTLRLWPRLREAEAGGVPLPQRPLRTAYRRGRAAHVATTAIVVLLLAAVAADVAADLSNLRLLLQILFVVCLSLAISYGSRVERLRVGLGILTGVVLIGWLASMRLENPVTPEKLARLPVLHGVVQTTRYNRLEVHRSPLLSTVNYFESGPIEEGWTESFCVDAATPALAGVSMRERMGPHHAYAPLDTMEPIAVPGVDMARYSSTRDSQLLVLQRGTRFVQVECWMEQRAGLEQDELIALVMETFFA